MALDGAPGVSISFPARELAGTDPAGLVTRLERRLVGLEDRKAAMLADIDHARGEITHATDAAAASAWLAGRPLPAFTLTGLAVLAHPASPAAAWHGQAGPAWLYWLAAAAVAAVAAGAGTTVWRLWQASATLASAGGDMGRRAGWANRAQVRRHAGQRMAARRARTIRPSLPRPRPADAGYLLGKSRGITCWASAEDSILLLGPPRSGKGMHVVIGMILDAPGAVVTTSTRPDNLAVTLTARRRMGPVMLFDPQGLAGGAGHTEKQGTLACG